MDKVKENLMWVFRALSPVFVERDDLRCRTPHARKIRQITHDRHSAQWRSKEDYAAMSKLPGIQAHMKAAAALATGFDPVDYDLRAVMLGEGE
jgi:hypothetical protein